MNRLSSPMDVVLEITYRCNYNCMHCRVPDGLKRGITADTGTEELTLEEIKTLLDELSEMDVFRFTVSGGEPTLREDLPEIIAYAGKKRFWTLFATNGSLITKDFARKIEESGLSEIHVGLDGATPSTHDTFRGQKGAHNCAVKAVTLLKEYTTIPVIVTTAASKFNYTEIKPLYTFVREELKADGFRIDFFTPAGHGKDFMKNLMLTPEQYAALYVWLYNLEKEEQTNFKISRTKIFDFAIEGKNSDSVMDNLRNRGAPACSAAATQCRISPGGDVFPCLYFNDSQFCAGNIRKTSLKEIWKSPVFESLCTLCFKGVCADCHYRNLCFGGCRGRAYSVAGELDGPDPYCPYSWPKESFSEVDT